MSSEPRMLHLVQVNLRPESIACCQATMYLPTAERPSSTTSYPSYLPSSWCCRMEWG